MANEEGIPCACCTFINETGAVRCTICSEPLMKRCGNVNCGQLNDPRNQNCVFCGWNPFREFLQQYNNLYGPIGYDEPAPAPVEDDGPAPAPAPVEDDEPVTSDDGGFEQCNCFSCQVRDRGLFPGDIDDMYKVRFKKNQER